MKKQCLDCGEAFAGRSDKKFCTDMCRNAYHNKFNGFRNAMIRHVNNRLRKNRHILFELGKSRPGEMSKEELTINGFDWQYFTEEQKVNNTIQRFCYDYGIRMNNDNRVVVIAKNYRSTVPEAGVMEMAAEEPEDYRL